MLQFNDRQSHLAWYTNANGLGLALMQCLCTLQMHTEKVLQSIGHPAGTQQAASTNPAVAASTNPAVAAEYCYRLVYLNVRHSVQQEPARKLGHPAPTSATNAPTHTSLTTAVATVVGFKMGLWVLQITRTTFFFFCNIKTVQLLV